MKTLLMFDIPRGKSGKKLRMRLLRLFNKENVNKFQDSIWDITKKEHLVDRIIKDFNELREEIKKEGKNEPRIVMIKGEVIEIG